MDGDLADLPNLVDLCDTFGATLMVDEAHATGVYGLRGTGTIEHFGLTGRIPLEVTTLSKALGAMGGVVLGDRATIAMLRTFASGYRFTSSLPAEQAAAVLAALTIIRDQPDIRNTLWNNVHYFRDGLRSLGIATKGSGPIVPVIVGAPTVAFVIERDLLDRGFWCAAVVPPAVAVDACRIRVTVTASHTYEDIDGLLSAFDDLDVSSLSLSGIGNKVIEAQPIPEPETSFPKILRIASDQT